MRVAVICNNHFSKGGGSANSRVIGSVAFVNQARAAFIVTPDEEDKTRMLLIPSKMNIAPIRHGLAYRIEGCLINSEGSEIATSRIMYESTPITISADQALAALSAPGENKSDKSEAIEFLKEVLRAGPVAAKDVKKEANGAGISPKSLRSAREALRIKPEKAGFEGGWVWKPRRCPWRPKMPVKINGHLRGSEGIFEEWKKMHTMTNAPEPSISSAAERMRRHRERRRSDLRCLTIEIREAEVAELIPEDY